MFVIPTSLIIMYIFFQRAKTNWYKHHGAEKFLYAGVYWLGIIGFVGLIVLSAMSPRF